MAEHDRDEKATLRHLGVREFRANIAAVLRQAQSGSSFLITSRDEVLAEIGPPSRAVRRPRQPGAMRGKIRMRGDFDALPSDVLAAMEGEEG